MKRYFFLLAILLPGCGGLEPLVAAPNMDNPECRQEVRRSPEVRNIDRQSNFENQTQVRRLTTLENEAETRIYNDCLRRRGISVPGGVAPIQQVW